MVNTIICPHCESSLEFVAVTDEEHGILPIGCEVDNKNYGFTRHYFCPECQGPIDEQTVLNEV